MSIDEKFDKVRLLLSAQACDFIVVYRATESKTGVALKRYKTATMREMSQEDLDRLAAKYQEHAKYYYEHGRNLVHRDSLSGENSSGRYWWHVIVGGGATRKAGYAIVALVAAKDPTELFESVAKIQTIIQSDSKP